MLNHRQIGKLSAVLAFGVLAGCNNERAPSSGASNAPVAPSTTAAPSGPQTPDPGGKIIAVELYTDGDGNYFKPADVTAKKGDVIRYTLKVGVHNVHFLPDSNAGKSGYPQSPSDFLQLPGQTYDVKVTFPQGKYYFQCDPHAALGMKGHLTVE
jgi:plastocyanin